MRYSNPIEGLARAALQGFFGEQGFRDMRESNPRNNSIRAMERFLARVENPEHLLAQLEGIMRGLRFREAERVSETTAR